MTRFHSLLLAAAGALAACGGKTPPTPPGNSAATPVGLPDRSIRSVDWQNRTYDLGGGDHYTVVNGQAELVYDADGNEMTPAEFAVRFPGVEPEIRGWFMVGSPVFGDVDGDNSDDAALTTVLNGGGSGQFSTITVFRMKAGTPAALGDIPGGDRADGGVAGVEITSDGAVVVERYVNLGDGACCPSASQFETWRWDGVRFVEDDAKRTVPKPLEG